MNVILCFIYPPLCLHCHRRVDHLHLLFCAHCLQYLTLIESIPHVAVCQGVAWYASACEPIGPAISLLREGRYGNRRSIQAIASLMVVRWNGLNWMMPDYIILLSTHCFPLMSQAGNFTRLLVKEFARMMGVLIITPLYRTIHLQYFIDSQETNPFQWIHRSDEKNKVIGKKLLLITPSIDRSTLDEAVALLGESFPREVRVLSFIDIAVH